MMTWTLFMLVSLHGEWGFIKHKEFTSELECKRAEQFVVSVPRPESMRLVATVCKKRIDV